MKIKVTRQQFDPEFTIGGMTVNGFAQCYTLEDTVRAPGEPKVFGKTAIPPGTYPVVITFSPHFQRDLPLLQNVPGFEGVRIHPGNTAADTEGCILVGVTRLTTSISHSRVAFDSLFPKIKKAIDDGEQVTIEVS